MKKCSIQPNTEGSQRHPSPLPFKGYNPNVKSPSAAVRDFKTIHSDLVTKPLNAKVIRQQEELVKKQEKEKKEHEIYEREYFKRKNLYYRMRRTYQKNLAKLDRSEDFTKDFLTEKKSGIRSASVDESARTKKTFRR